MVQVGFLIRMGFPAVMMVMLSRCHKFDSCEQKSCDTSGEGKKEDTLIAPSLLRRKEQRSVTTVMLSRCHEFDSREQKSCDTSSAASHPVTVDSSLTWKAAPYPQTASALVGLPVSGVMENEQVVLPTMTLATVDSDDTFHRVPGKVQERALPCLPASAVAAQRRVMMTLMTPATVDSHDSSLICQENWLQHPFLVRDSLRHFHPLALSSESEVLPHGRYEQH
jgi:hypothetical protein